MGGPWVRLKRRHVGGVDRVGIVSSVPRLMGKVAGLFTAVGGDDDRQLLQQLEHVRHACGSNRNARHATAFGSRYHRLNASFHCFRMRYPRLKRASVF